jgi:hypothetical protein
MWGCVGVWVCVYVVGVGVYVGVCVGVWGGVGGFGAWEGGGDVAYGKHSSETIPFSTTTDMSRPISLVIIWIYRLWVGISVPIYP